MLGERSARGHRPTKGHQGPKALKVRNMVAFDPDMRDEVEEVARELNVPFAEAVRILIEWGLESRR